MDDDFHIPSNTKELDNALHDIHSNLIKPNKDVSTANKAYLKKVLEHMVSGMKKDAVFKALYGELWFQGSSYEKLRVAHVDEFDINLELQLPVDYAELKIETEESTPGFARIKLGAVTGEKGEQVQKTVQEWIDGGGYLLRDKILSWINCLVCTVLVTEMEFKVSIVKNSEPAITLMVRTTYDESFFIDLVPCLMLDGKNLPASVQKHLDALPKSIHGPLVNEKWSVIPKGPREIAGSEQFVIGENGNHGREWRMSFYEYERKLMTGLDGMKPTIKLLKLLRDIGQHTILASYYIKTVFLWEIDNNNIQMWHKKDHGYLFVYMLRIFEGYLYSKFIPFFWDERHNHVSHLTPRCMEKVGNYLQERRIDLEQALRTHEHDPIKMLYEMFKYEKPHLENYIHVSQYDVRCLVEDEEEEERQPLLQKENEGSCFNWKSLLLLGVGSVTVIGGIVLYETQGKTEGQ